MMSAFGLYKPRRDRSRIGEQAQVFKSAVVMVAVLALSGDEEEGQNFTYEVF